MNMPCLEVQIIICNATPGPRFTHVHMGVRYNAKIFQLFHTNSRHQLVFIFEAQHDIPRRTSAAAAIPTNDVILGGVFRIRRCAA